MSLFHEPMILGACFIVAVSAAVTDFFTRKIPNLLSLGGLVFGLAAHGAIGFVEAGSRGALRGTLLALAGAVLCAIFPVIAFVRGKMGGGDVKLFAAIGAMAGPSLGMDAEFATILFAALVLYPWGAIRSGAFRAKIEQFRAAMRGETLAPRAPIEPPRFILAPSILLGLCIALLRHGIIPSL